MPRLSLENHSINYEIHGHGKPVVIFSGIMMQTSSWHMLLPLFKIQRQIILVDFPNQGQSSSIVEQISIEEVAELMMAFIDTLGIGKFDLIGISYGAQVAMHLAVLAKDRLEQLVLANSAMRTTHHLRAIGESWKMSSIEGDVARFFDTCMPFIYSSIFYETHHGWLMQRREALGGILTPDWFSRFNRLVDSASSHDASEKLTDISADTLVLSSTHDILTPVESMEAIAKAIPKTRHVTIANAGHASMYESPEKFSELINEFLS